MNRSRRKDQLLRRAATGLLEAVRKFWKVNRHRELEALYRRISPSLTQQDQVA